jgi:hypothetical protein
MTQRIVTLALAASVTLFAGPRCVHARPTAQPRSTTRTIDVTGGEPVVKAIDVIEQRYGVPIDYTGPIYASTQDTQFMYSIHGKSLNPPALVPRIRTISVQYEEVNESPKGISYLSCKVQSLVCNPVGVWPKRGIAALIRKVLNNLAANGGQVFTVRKVWKTKGPWYEVGPRWEVYPVKARNASGAFVSQPDFLGAIMHIPTARRTLYQMLDLIAQQLTRRWGLKFFVGFTRPWDNDVGIPPGKSELGAEGVTARQAIMHLLDPTDALRILGGVGDPPRFGINVAALPYREPPRPPTSQAVPARMAPPRPYRAFEWLAYSHSSKGTREIQDALSQAGYLHTEPTSKWDANAVSALRSFQTANGLQPTGTFDILTAGKLLPYLPEHPAHLVPAKPAMDPALAYWLESTSDGRKEIEQALAKAGFYHGTIASAQNNPAALAALKAFQKANGLQPTGYFDYATAEKLAPFIPNPKQ